MSVTRSEAEARTAASARTGVLGNRFGFVLAIAAQILMLAGASAPSPFYPVLADRIGFGTSVIGTVFAVYAVTLLLTLLTAGSLSDYIGRRPVAIAGFVVLAGSMVLFWHADSVTMLVLARAVQGLASGLLISALSATALDFAPAHRPGLAALWNALAPGIGLALGALVSGIALEVADAALADVFLSLTATYLVVAALFATVPETSPGRTGAWASLRFRLSVPAAIRADFWRSAPAIVAGWATGGLFLSLGANIVRQEPGGTTHLWQALPVVVLAGVGALAAFLLRRRAPRTSLIVGTAALAAGTTLSLVALAFGSLWFYLGAVAVTGTGFGTAFSGVLGSLTPRIPAAERADTFAVIFLLAYLSFGVPSVLAGMLVPVAGLSAVCVGYGVVVILLAVTALVLRVRRPD
ncbi:MFS transporter [Microbacterium elymi]|uniref:MFS transporter n=1 Tax=Microbacterium elymi TaxID=2909587 RepID=A0ABY5NH52_9MICO|nr:MULTISPECIES: MFS transporter [Microbacterium]UUT34519.1 MFS transporter [Microbacterium elymi]